MFLIIGLGNPGEKFNNTPHNIGFDIIDKFAEKNNFPNFVLFKKFNSFISEGVIGEEKILLAKPQTFMNESGKAVKEIIKNLKLKIKNLLVVHDDIDLPFGTIKIVKNRGSAGHKGIESIMKTTGNENLIRIRVGVLPTKGKLKEVKKFVLKKLNESEKNILNKVIDRTVMAIETLAINGLEKAMNEYNK